jgi:ribosomal protein S19
MRSSYKLFINYSSNYVSFGSRLKKRFNSVLGKIEKNPDFILWRPKTIAIYPSLFGKKLAIYSGNFFTSLQVKRSMFFFKPSAFVRTKRLGSLIHTVKRKKKK